MIKLVVMTGVFLLLGVVVGPAFTRIRHTNDGVRLSEVRDYADESTVGIREGIERLLQRPQRTSELTDGDKLLFGGVVVVLVVVAYLRFRAPVLVGLVVLSLLIAIFATVALIRLARAGVITDGRGIASALISSYLAAAVGLINVTLLWDPPAGGQLFRDFLAAFQRGEGFHSIEGMMFVIYQIVGALGFVLVSVFSLMFAFALLSALSIFRKSWGGWLHRLTYGVTAFAWSTWVGVIAVVLSVISVLLSGGWVFTWITQVSPAPTPAS